MRGRVILVDDDPALGEMLGPALGRRGFEVRHLTRASEALLLLNREDFDVVVTDLQMPQMNGIELCSRIAALRPQLPVVVITAFGSMDAAISAIRTGAYDFVTKPFDIESLVLTLERAVQHHSLREKVRRLEQAVAEASHFGELLGASSKMRELFDFLGRVAGSESTILITGESGTGKELVARALHDRGKRKAGPFVAVNLAAIPETLLESELFGHVKGAFTDARNAHQGLFLEAQGGTLFLDEIGEMPLTLQPKLLRVLQERMVRPVGGTGETPVDVRVIAATNRDLQEATEQGRFRQDLLYRIDVIRVEMPPLRDRGGDVLILATRFLEIFAERAGRAVRTISPEAAERLVAYDWPGNVRELQNCIERAVALARFDAITVADLPERVRDHSPTRVLVAAEDSSELISMEELERRYILRVLQKVGGNKALAARILGFDRKTLYRKLDRYGAGTG